MTKQVVIEYKQQINLSLKAIFLLQEIAKRKDAKMGFWSEDDWLHCEKNIGYSGPVDEPNSTRAAFYELTDSRMLVRCDSGTPDTYFQFGVGEKAANTVEQWVNIDTSEFKYLKPKTAR